MEKVPQPPPHGGTTGKAGGSAQSAILPNKQARLKNLRTHGGVAGTTRNPGDRPEKPGPNPRRMQILLRVYRMLTQTPDDGTGLVPDTPFSKAGVAELMKVLKQRSADQRAPGGKAAANAMNFLAPDDGEDSIAGASVAKLQLVARMASRLRGGSK